jgi:glycosyltransferase involved in cell wall biosynthesis
LKIAVIGIRGVPANYGGFEVTAENVVTRLVERGHKVTVYCRGNSAGKLSEYKGLSLKYLPSIEMMNLSTPSHSLFAVIAALFCDYDAIFGFNIGNSVFFAISRLFGQKTTIFVDGLDWKREKWGNFARWYLKKNEYLSTKICSHIVVDATPAQKHFADEYGVNVQYIPSGADIVDSVEPTGILEKLGLTKKRFVSVIGRLTKEKRQDLIVSAFRKVDTDMKLVVVGGNPYDTDFVESVRAAAGDDKRIVLTGPVYGKEVDELYFESAVFVNASTVEGTSLSILQAMGNGCALLVSDIPENVSAVYGGALEFETHSPDNFVEQFQRIIDDEPLRAELSAKAKDVVRKYYSWDVATDKFERLLTDTARRRSKIKDQKSK